VRLRSASSTTLAKIRRSRRIVVRVLAPDTARLATVSLYRTTKRTVSPRKSPLAFATLRLSGTGRDDIALRLTARQAKALRAGLFHRVPIISGNNHDEANGWLAAFGDIKDYPALVRNMVGAQKAPEVLRHYPQTSYESPAAAWGAVTTDRIWSCTQVAADQQAARKVPVYAYEFADKHSPIAAPGLGAAHAMELPYLFRLGGYDFPMSETQQRLSNQMIDYWTKFVATGAPDVDGQPAWPEVGNDPGAENRLSLQPDGSRLETGFEEAHQCRFWAELER